MRFVWPTAVLAIGAVACADSAAAPEASLQAELVESTGRTQTATSGEQRLLVRTGTIRIRVDNLEGAVGSTDSLASSLGGYVAESRFVERDGGVQSAILTIRIPTEGFDIAWDALSRLGSVRSGEVGTADVTTAYRDLETRLGVKEQTVDRLRDLLASRAGNLSEVLEVERELSRVVTELEQLKGEREALRERLAMSTLSVQLFLSGVARAPSLPPSIGGALRQSLEALRTALAWSLYLAVYVAPWFVIGALAWLSVRWMRRKLRMGGEVGS